MASNQGSNDGYAKVHITDDGMAAYLTVYGPKDGGRSVTLQGLIAKLKEAGVVEGIDFGNVNLGEKYAPQCCDVNGYNFNRPSTISEDALLLFKM